ncbi:MAG: hypothetical protein APR53_06165 [Methanoculleus sp. SDB]|nr:MAG: hypothetical protein APR53_06165 [Methanoculleus sp. SDB]
MRKFAVGMVAHTLALREGAVTIGPDRIVCRPGNTQNHIDSVVAEQFDSAGAHAAGNDAGNSLVMQKCGKFPRFMARARDRPAGYRFAVDVVDTKFRYVAKMRGNLVPVKRYGNSQYNHLGNPILPRPPRQKPRPPPRGTPPRPTPYTGIWPGTGP